MRARPKSLSAFFALYRLPLALGAIAFLLPLLPRALSGGSQSVLLGVLWLLALTLLAPLGALLGWALAWFGRGTIAQLGALALSIAAGFFMLIVGLRLVDLLETHLAAHWRREYSILVAGLMIWALFRGGFALMRFLTARLLARMQQDRRTGRLAAHKDHQRVRFPGYIVKPAKALAYPILTLLVVFISSSMAFFIPSFSAPLFWFVIVLSGVAALAMYVYLQRGAQAKPLVGILWCAGALLATAKALQPKLFANLPTALLVVLSLAALFVLLHFAFPAATLWVRREMFAPTTKLGRGCLSISLGLVGTGGALGASWGRRLAQQIDDRNTSFAIMGACLLFVAFLVLNTVVSQYIHDRQPRQE